MPINNFKLFDQNKANMLTDTEYANSAQRLNGVQTGVASSQLNNKFAYQASLVAYAIAQIMNQNNLDASDTLAVSAFVGNLGSALLQKVADKASTAEAAAGVLNNKYITPATMKAAALLLSGGTMTGPIAMGNNKITGLADPTAITDAATKGYVDKKINNVPGDLSTDGFHLFGYFVSDGGGNPRYTVNGLSNFLSRNIGKVSQLVIKFNNVKFKILISNGYKRYKLDSSYIFSISSGTTGEFVLNNTYYCFGFKNEPLDNNNVVSTNNNPEFVFISADSDGDNAIYHTIKGDVVIWDNSYNENAIKIESGTIELWYK